MILIIAAAIKVGNRLYFIPKPARHHNIIHQMAKNGLKPYLGIQGFITSDDRFVDRAEAMEIAIRSGQFVQLINRKELFSEDLW